MGVIAELLSGYEKGTEAAENAAAGDFSITERHVADHSEYCDDRLAVGDNLSFMRGLLDSGYKGKFRCIYIDPPFFTKASYDATVTVKGADGKKHRIKHLAYDDTFDRDLECYIMNMTSRLILMRELLAEDGLIWVHLDWHSSHYIRAVLDEVFGEKNFQNEIIWKYKSGGSGKRHFSRKHDTILVYSRSKKYYIDIPKEKSYNRGLKPYRFRGVKEYKDEYGWYTLVNMKDVWNVDMVGRTSSERTGYASQKPLELMRRIVCASSEPGDLVGDFFCGSGSFLEAAQIEGRKWIGCDREMMAASASVKRLDERGAKYVVLSDDTEGPLRGRAFMTVKRTDELVNGKKLYTCALTAFRPDIDTGHIQIKDRGTIEQLLEESPLSLVDHVMIDPDFDGVFSVENTVSEDFGEIRFISRGNYSVTAVDVFGKEYLVDEEEEK
jgi:site-specific DNA-methyltransferase (adenine-specific)